MPPIIGENTFSCKIDGKLFVPKDHGGFPIIQKGVLIDLLDNRDWNFQFSDAHFDIYLHLAQVTATGTYSLGRLDGNSFYFQEPDNLMEADLDKVNTPFGSTHVPTSSSGVIKILEFEMDKRIVLEFDDLLLEGVDDTFAPIKLTEGKLNINLETFWNE